ncbi:MAG: hypothetical protein KJN66_08580 [Bacteroidia bacterium]|nr:hypothetical protein [Bacteroidia bacterium]
MNPSASGWIKKLVLQLEKKQTQESFLIEELYFDLRSCGFIYGSNQAVVNDFVLNKDLTKEEYAKANLLIALFSSFKSVSNSKYFVESVIDFYLAINEHKTSFFDDILNRKKSSNFLEKIIHKRIQLDDNLLTKNFNYFITNALLFVDVLAYLEFLEKGGITEEYIRNLESTIETIVIDVLNSKKYKTKYDKSLIKLLESSLRYQNTTAISYEQAIALSVNDLEANYILDVACMASWGDQRIDDSEKKFLEQLGTDLNISPGLVTKSLSSVIHFYTVNRDNIALLSSKNVVKSFYDNSSKMVSKLISRNSKRLINELRESKDVMVLLSKSTVRDLTDEELKKVQDQLIDIFKSIPSLAIFMLPGGALLLPLVIKFIPKLLPSAFDDNRVED